MTLTHDSVWFSSLCSLNLIKLDVLQKGGFTQWSSAKAWRDAAQRSVSCYFEQVPIIIQPGSQFPILCHIINYIWLLDSFCRVVLDYRCSHEQIQIFDCSSLRLFCFFLWSFFSFQSKLFWALYICILVCPDFLTSLHPTYIFLNMNYMSA